ncbi:MAG: hypothetical protein PVG49_08585 [Desulfobacteraceae bacterium]
MTALRSTGNASLPLVPSRRGSRGKRRCLSCGTPDMNGGRRYCSKECREQMMWVLSLSKGLLRAFNARYAAFYFDDEHVVLDILPLRSGHISRFSCRRRGDRKPADDLKALVLQSGEEWHDLVSNHHSKGYATLFLLRRNHDHSLQPESVKPDCRTRPRFSRKERESMKTLNIGVNDLLSAQSVLKIKSAYKQKAKLHHPDMGGDAEDFRRLAEAHQQMLLWAKNPQFTSRKALTDCWSYDGFTNRWVPPL